MKLYVKFAEEKKPKTVSEFLQLFYSRRIDSFYAYGCYTYYDKECKVTPLGITNREDILTYIK